MKLNVLIIGSGGREHALALKISQSDFIGNLFCLTGNPGTSKFCININIDQNDFVQIKKFCLENRIDLVVIGPENYIVNGLPDYLRENNINVFAPSKSASQIEASKSFAKKIMKQAKVPTADYRQFDRTQINAAIEYLKNLKYPIVIKADGLASGKGVTICQEFEESKHIIENIFIKNIFGNSGQRILIEEFLSGQEISLFAITDGKEFVTLPAAQDHKKIGDGDTGSNTGGMGAYAPVPFCDKNIILIIEQKIIQPIIRQMFLNGYPFIGCLYAGLIITDDGPKVIEFNCRFGDPETQVVLPLIGGDFLQLLYSSAIGKLNKNSVYYNGKASVCVVAASKGYPDAYQVGYKINGLENFDSEIIIYHAGTIEKNGIIFTNGGRVLAVTSVIDTNDIISAQKKAYNAIGKIDFQGIYFRKDIASKATNYLMKTFN